MANEFSLLTWYEQAQMVLTEGFQGIGTLLESTFEESMLWKERKHVVLYFKK